MSPARHPPPQHPNRPVFGVVVVNGLSRAGTRGHYLMFPRKAHRQAGLGLYKRIERRLTPSMLGNDHRERQQAGHSRDARSGLSSGRSMDSRPHAVQT
jgi:hypothetical protein